MTIPKVKLKIICQGAMPDTKNSLKYVIIPSTSIAVVAIFEISSGISTPPI